MNKITENINFSKVFVVLTISLIVVHFTIRISSSESTFESMFKSSNQYKDVVVQEVINVDTFVIENTLRKGETIKLIGIRGPKEFQKKKDIVKRDRFGFEIKNKAETPITPMDDQAYEFVRELLEGKHVRLEFDSDKKDDDYKTLAYVFLMDNNTFVNVEILRQGFGYLQISPPNTKYAKQMREAYQEARKEMRGYQGE